MFMMIGIRHGAAVPYTSSGQLAACTERAINTSRIFRMVSMVPIAKFKSSNSHAATGARTLGFSRQSLRVVRTVSRSKGFAMTPQTCFSRTSTRAL